MAEKVLHEFEWGGYGYRIAEGGGEREGWGPWAQMRNDEGHWFDWTGGHRPLVREILRLSAALAEAEERKTGDRYWEGHRDGVADERERAKGNDVVFTCPRCGTPSAQTAEPHLDIHAGATYTCDNCQGAVVFEALTVDEYIERQPDPDKSARTRAEGRIQGMREALKAVDGSQIENPINEYDYGRSEGAGGCFSSVARLIAAAERELAGGKGE